MLSDVQDKQPDISQMPTESPVQLAEIRTDQQLGEESEKSPIQLYEEEQA